MMRLYTAGIDIGATNIKFGVFDAGGKALYTRVCRSAQGDAGATAAQIQEMLACAPVQAARIGVGVPGTVFMPSGEVYSGNLKWRGEPFGRQLSRLTGLPVWLDNDAQTALAAETLPGGACHGLESAVYLTLGTGVGGALLVNGRPWRGHDHAAAELGHFVTHAGGLKCACGMRGCFEMYACAGALTRMAGGVRARAVIDRARAGDAQMLRAMDAYAREVAIGICSLYMIFRPQAMVLGGGLSAAGDMLISAILASVRPAYSFGAEELAGVLRLASQKNDAGMAGAAVLARMNLT